MAIGRLDGGHIISRIQRVFGFDKEPQRVLLSFGFLFDHQCLIDLHQLRIVSAISVVQIPMDCVVFNDSFSRVEGVLQWALARN
jgi:hypothetical protein